MYVDTTPKKTCRFQNSWIHVERAKRHINNDLVRHVLLNISREVVNTLSSATVAEVKILTCILTKLG